MPKSYRVIIKGYNEDSREWESGMIFEMTYNNDIGFKSMEDALNNPVMDTLMRKKIEEEANG